MIFQCAGKMMDIERLEALLYRVGLARRGAKSASLTLDQTCVARKELRRILTAERHGVDPEFVAKNPQIHQLMMAAYKALKQGKEFVSPMPSEPAHDGGEVRSPLISAFQVKYESLHTAMTKMRDHYREFGNVPAKWIALVRSRYEAYVPLLQQVMRDSSEEGIA